MSNPPPMIKDIEEVVDRMGFNADVVVGNFLITGTSTMLPTDFIDPEVCAKFGIENMEDLMEFMESVEYEDDDDDEDDGVTSYTLTPVESKRQIKYNAITSDSTLADGQQRGRFWCNKDFKFVNIETCIGCTPFFDGYNKITCILTCNYKFSM